VKRLAVVLTAGLLVACSSTASESTGRTAVITAVAASTSTTSTSPSTTSTSTTSTLPTTTTSTIPGFLGEEVIGTSVQGRPITAYHRGTAGGIVILVVGVIHGNEDDGLAVIDLLRTMPLPSGYDLWLLPMLNPDGQANQTRGNGNGVDLNRNFPYEWGPLGAPGDSQYSGSGPGSEPETQAFIAFTQRIRPRLTLWYHQNAFLVQPSQRADGPLRKKYAELTGLPYETLSGTGSTFSGIAATWVRTQVPDAMSFIVELGDDLPPDLALIHANAVITVMQMVTA
jgi:protein MpaA